MSREGCRRHARAAPRLDLAASDKTVAHLMEAEAVVRFARPTCRAILKVDLSALAIVCGRSYSLIGER